MALTADRVVDRSPGDEVTYKPSPAYQIFAGGGVMIESPGVTDGLIRPAVRGVSSVRFLGVADTGATNAESMDVYKTGVFSFDATGTGSSSDIGKPVYFIDDITVGTSVAPPYIEAGEVTGLVSTSKYRVRIDNAVGKISTNA